MRLASFLPAALLSFVTLAVAAPMVQEKAVLANLEAREPCFVGICAGSSNFPDRK